MQLPQKTKEIFNKYLRPRTVGASIITGAADNDPSGITTYAQIGVATGFSLLWLLALSTVLLYTLEEMAGRVVRLYPNLRASAHRSPNRGTHR